MDAETAGWSATLASVLMPWALAAAATKFTLYVSAFLACGLLLFRLALPEAGNRLFASLKPVTLVAIVVAAAATLLRVGIQAGRLLDDGLAGMIDPDMIALSVEGPLGQSSAIRLIGLSLLLLAVLWPRLRVFASLLGAILVAFSFALVGHATREPQWALAALLTVHLLGIFYWWGAILPLHRLSGPAYDHVQAAAIAERFGRQASFIVPLLIAAGLALGWFLLGGPVQLVESAYGRMLLIKLGLVGLVLVMAALNKLRFVPDLMASKPGAAARFRRSLLAEGALFLAVFAATAVLTTSFTVPVR